MAIIQIVNVSTPNDGLGDPLRVSQVKANDNFSELNAKKVEAVAGFDLSENNFTDAEKAKLSGIEPSAQVNVRGNWQQQDPNAPDYVLGKPTNGNIITYGTYALVGQTLTIFAGWVWQINDVLYTNSADIVINFPFAATGLQRYDVIVFDTLNNAQRVDGDEVVSSPIVPLLIPDSILFSISLITDVLVGEPVIPTPVALHGSTSLRFSGAGQNYTLPLGCVAFKGWINDGAQHLEQAGFEADLNTFTQLDTTVTFKKSIAIGARIVIDYYF